jgi:predicted enzyme related to lactoylglutathione lyase
MKFSGAMIGSEDPDALASFYTSVLGEPAMHDGSWYGWGEDAWLMLGPHSEVHGKNATPQRMMVMVEAADVNAAYAALVGLGAKVIAEPYKPEPDREMLLATLEDPDGNYLQLVTPWEE